MAFVNHICHLISTPTTRNYTRGATLHLMDCSGAGWSWELSRSRSGCDLIDSVLILRRRRFFGARPADGVPSLTPGGSEVCGSLIRPVPVARDLGVMLQSDLSMKDHVARTVSRCFRQLRLLKGCIKS